MATWLYKPRPFFKPLTIDDYLQEKEPEKLENSVWNSNCNESRHDSKKKRRKRR